MYRDDFLQKKLQDRIANNSLRKLMLPAGKVDLCSNDYLGIVTHSRLPPANQESVIALASGSKGSRLLSGNYQLIEELERKIADFHHSETALLFNSGYDANLGLLSSVPQKGDTILYDHLSHASIRDGIRLSFAQSFSFGHNDLQDLEKKIKHSSGTLFIVTESVFSMDGDLGLLESLVQIAQKYSAHLIIDEAHATGVIGERGEGLVQKLGLENQVFARVHTFGKACGSHGAAILGSESLRNYLINFARSFIYSTALPEQSVYAIDQTYQLFPSMQSERAQLQLLIRQFQTADIRYQKLLSSTPIQGIMIPGNENVKQVAASLQNKGFDIRPILYPTVPKDKERLRVVLHSFNSTGEIDQLIKLL